MSRYTGKKCRLLTMFWFTATFFLVEVIVGYATNSMALVADSFHMLSDVTALLITFLSLKMAPKKWSKNTYGCARAEVLGALINAVFLAALCFSITVEAIKRFIEAEEIREPLLILVVGGTGLLVNIVGMFLFHEHGSHSHNRAPLPERVNVTQIVNSSDENEDLNSFIKRDNVIIKPTSHQHSHNSTHLNMRGIFLHVVADALGSVIVVISAAVVWLTDWKYRFYLDPALSLVLVLIIVPSLWPLLRDSSLILLQTVPPNMRLEDLERNLSKIDGVLSVHEFHLWQLTGDRIIASAHIRCRSMMEYMKTAESVKTFFHNEGVHSITIQPEFNEDYVSRIPSNESNVKQCLLDCPDTGAPCIQSTCCGTPKNETNGRAKPIPDV